MKVLILGSGGREHALALAMSRDPEVTELHVAPGNPGTAGLATNHQCAIIDPAAVLALATRLRPDLVVVGPEGPLVAGVANPLRAAGFAVFGPDAAAAQIEGSKAFAKQIMASAEIPTAMAHVCTTEQQVLAAMAAFGTPYVIKDDGLAAGKGVVVTLDADEAISHARSCLTAGSTVVVEEFLDGPEVSLFALSDGVNVVALQPAQDFKRLLDADLGPNTGGMGAYSPLPWAPATLVPEVLDRVVRPAIAELAHRGTPFVGLLYAGLALTSRGVRVIEFNARFGDPETQVVLALLRSPLGVLLAAAAAGRLEDHEAPVYRSGAAVGVVLAAPGYPAAPSSGARIGGLDQAAAVPGASVIHAGTALDDSGQVCVAGGRVLTVVGTGADLHAARASAYEAAALIELPGAQLRTDIALAAADGLVTIPSR